MEYKLIIPGRLPGLNEYVSAERASRYSGAKLKSKSEQIISDKIDEQLKGIKIKNPVELHYLWAERDMRRDRDNVAFAKKFVQDALVSSGVLKNDDCKHVVGFSDRFEVDRENPRIEILIKEV